MLLTLLRQIRTIPERGQALNALRFLHAGVSGPLRHEIFKSIETVRRGGPVSDAVKPLLEDPRIVRPRFLSDVVKKAVCRRVKESCAPVPALLDSRTPGVSNGALRVEDFFALPDETAGWVIGTWQVYQRRIEEYHREGLKGKLPQEYRLDPVKHYRDLAKAFLEEGRVNNGMASKILAEGEKFFPIRLRIICESGEPRTSIEASRKIRRLSEFYDVKIDKETTGRLLESLDSLALYVRDQSVNPDHGRAMFAAAMTVLPNSPAWFREMLIHFHDYRDLSPDHFGFVLRASRLLQRLSKEEAGRAGFKAYEIFQLEQGKKVRRKKFRSAVVLYGVPYDRLSFAYFKTHYFHLNLDRLTFYAPGLFDEFDIPKIESYFLKTPSLGERVFFARVGQDLSVDEIVKMARVKHARIHEALESNKGYPTFEVLKRFSKMLLIPIDEMLSLLLLTYYPSLKHPRFATEPVYIHPNERGEVEKIRGAMKEPGSLGEEIFFRRKRKFLTLAQLAEMTGIHKDRISLFEYNRATPNDEEMARLAAALRRSADDKFGDP